MMTHDPIIEEIHAFRAAHAKRFDYDLKAICHDLQVRQAGRSNLVDLSGGHRTMAGITAGQRREWARSADRVHTR
uniref:Uncharacterized protein n=1 Tax=Candidatus Kentrum sp. FM TaxID=2126340 RepID=A0A450S0U4_9GAMM|nr:MAG: hypothetical protein BECKFM1743C_GA0114222_100237 [Candidatus Kentron sp. FM]VFJ51493.1 MAG: hypothetical protein BECKFM1743A_GA0114220_100947 [Candidatus Kentron sp. FM]VFK05887.1 MAG: hypothetical protein BECKFM1743B_GA0114221_100067 [Candidatus Kentron sp. FM]